MAARKVSGSKATKTTEAASVAVARGRRERTIDRRRDREVLDAAARIFREKGYADTSIQEVADSLGMLKGSLYYYIDKKEDLLFRLLNEVHDDVDVILQDVAARTDLPALDRLNLYVQEQVLYSLKNLEKISVYYHDIDALTPDRRQVILKRREPHEDFVTGLITEAQREGTADPDGDARLLRNCVFAVMIWVYRWYQPGARLRAETIAALCADFARSGVVGGAALASPAPVPNKLDPAAAMRRLPC